MTEDDGLDDELEMFIEAQDTVWSDVLRELEQGQKTSHWMWFVFPQLRGLGRSPMAQLYGIADLAEARAYLAHPVLGPRLRDATDLTLTHAIFCGHDDPAAAPAIRFNYMSHARDWEEFRTCIRLTREIFAQPAFEPFAGAEIQPGPGVQGDADLDAFIAEHAESAFHPCGTCRMGRADDAGAVVDPEGRVIGVERLRVADSSIFPRITNGNLNAPSIMVGEKIADHLLGRDPLPRANDRPWLHPRWQDAQR